MTPQSRAEKIAEWIHSDVHIRPEEIRFITAQITEAEREAFKEGVGVGRETSLEHYNNGFRAAQEKAAIFVYKKYWSARAQEGQAEQWLSDKIRALKPDFPSVGQTGVITKKDAEGT